MDEALFSWFNGWNGAYPILDTILTLFRTTLFKAVPFMLVFWGLWFWPKSPEQRTRLRESLTAALVSAVPILGITRAIANFAPYSARPIHTPGLDIQLYDGQPVGLLDGWSSMPSDHASLFMGFAVAVLCVHRGAGLFLVIWAAFVTSIPRIILGYHWPSDILVGWLVGAILALVLIGPITRFLRWGGIVRFFEEREAIGYPLLFFATFEFARLFSSSRRLIEILAS